jgi:Family of unknown function (DUF6573)
MENTMMLFHATAAAHTRLQPFKTFTKAFFRPRAQSRRQNLDDGWLVDVSDLAKAYFNVPVAMTRDVWELCIAMNSSESFAQQFRLCSLLCQAKMAAMHTVPHAREVTFDIKPFPRNSQSFKQKIKLCLRIETDQEQPVLTLMLDEQRLGEQS